MHFMLKLYFNVEMLFKINSLITRHKSFFINKLFESWIQGFEKRNLVLFYNP